MSNYAKGKTFEQKVAAMIRKKADLMAKRNPGSHANWHRRSDIFTNLPLHIEVKDQETVKIKEWFEQADAAASFHQTPIVAFHKDEEVLACLRLNDLLDLFMQIADNKAEIDDLRQPPPRTPAEILQPAGKLTQKDFIPRATEQALDAVEKPVQQVIQRGAKTCRAGHLADEYGYCMQLTCKYSRGYKPPKGKKK